MQNMKAIEQTISLGTITLYGNLAIPKTSTGIVLFAHGSGSGRMSPRNQFVAEVLNKGHIATLLVDLLTEQEAKTDEISGAFRFNIDLLSKRLGQITDWLGQEKETKGMNIAYFGASTGAAAALIAAAQKGALISSVVSRGGRPDLANPFLSQVQAPTLLIVGEKDPEVIALNQEAFQKLSCLKKMEIVPGASHLFEEPGCLEKVSLLARDWFKTHF
jgi:putative phosphoribosyl transferase